MKFSDLEFKPHIVGAGATQARVQFENGYLASVISGALFNTSDDAPYELAVLLNGKCCYDTRITNDVEGYLNEDDVTALLQRIESLPDANCE